MHCPLCDLFVAICETKQSCAYMCCPRNRKHSAILICSSSLRLLSDKIWINSNNTKSLLQNLNRDVHRPSNHWRFLITEETTWSKWLSSGWTRLYMPQLIFSKESKAHGAEFERIVRAAAQCQFRSGTQPGRRAAREFWGGAKNKFGGATAYVRMHIAKW